jgi:hypothetical protein
MLPKDMWLIGCKFIQYTWATTHTEEKINFSNEIYFRQFLKLPGTYSALFRTHCMWGGGGCVNNSTVHIMWVITYLDACGTEPGTVLLYVGYSTHGLFIPEG